MVVMTKLTRVLPWIGLAFALAALASTMRRKGVLRGALDAALDATPVVGGVKMVAERLRGRDFISDRTVSALSAAGGPP
jgi:hypothetical protein